MKIKNLKLKISAMNVRYILLSLILIGVCTFFGYNVTHALFSDTSQSQDNTFSAAPIFPGSPGSVVINEVSSGGNQNQEWVELFNKTSFPINVGGWTIVDNGPNPDTLPSVTIPTNGYGVIVTNNTTVSGIPETAVVIQLSGNDIGNGLLNSGDRLILRNSDSIIIDQMNYGGDTSGIFASPPPAPTSSQSLSRISNGIDTDSGADWQIDTSPTIGVENSL